MKKNWNDLPQETRKYINDRFSQYKISGEDAYNDKTLFPDEMKELESDEIIEILKSKDISHVMPSSEYPELESDLNNIILEDSSINRARGSDIMTDDEIETAQYDYYDDIDEYEDHLDVFDNLPEILLGSTVIGLGLTSYSAFQKVKNNEITLNEVPRYILIKSSKKVVKAAIIGVCATSGMPILVTGAFAYSLYKAKGLIKSAIKGSWRVLTHPVTVNIATNTGIIALKIIDNTFNVVGYLGDKILLKITEIKKRGYIRI